MRAYRVASGRTIAPFGDLARDLYVGVKPLSQWQADSLSACGLELVDVQDPAEAKERPCMVFWDDVFFTEMALRQFVADGIGSDEDFALAMPDSAVLNAYAPLQGGREIEGGGMAFDVFFLVKDTPARSREDLAGRSRSRPVQMRELTRSVRLPPVGSSVYRGPSDEKTKVIAPITARIVANVRHWTHLLRLSQLSVGVELLDRLRKKPRLILRLRLMKGRDPWEIARKLNFVDPTARVHPTADLESAVIGPGCVVQAHAHVHRSVLGANVELGDHCAVMGSTLAEEVRVLPATYMALCASMPGGTLANYKVQLSLFGRGVFLTSSAWLIDAKFRGDVLVEHDGNLASTETPFLGCCLGHRVTLGAQVAIQSGRAVANGSTIVGRPEEVASKLGSYPDGTVLTVRNGQIEPIK